MIQFIQDSDDRKWVAFVGDVRDDPSMFANAALKHHVQPSSVKFLLVVPNSSQAWLSVTRLPTAMHLFVPDMLVTKELNGMLVGAKVTAGPRRRQQVFSLLTNVVQKFDESAKKVIAKLGR